MQILAAAVTHGMAKPAAHIEAKQLPFGEEGWAASFFRFGKGSSLLDLWAASRQVRGKTSERVGMSTSGVPKERPKMMALPQGPPDAQVGHAP